MMDHIHELFEELLQRDQQRFQYASKELIARGRDSVDVLVNALPTATDQQRWRIIHVLSKIADPRAIPAIIDCLHSSSPAIQAMAAQFLGEMQSDMAVDPLVQLLRANPNNNSIVWIIQALGRLRSSRAVEPLIYIVRTTESEAVRYTAIEALGLIGDEQATGVIEPYVNHQNHHVRSRAQQALRTLSH